MDMKIALAGGAGRIGTHIAKALVDHGYEVETVSPRHGRDALTGHGLAEAFEGASVVVDTMNLPTQLPNSRAVEFFETATANLLAAGRAAGVSHHVLLSIVGVDRVESDYFLGKRKQEQLVREQHTPFTIVRSTSVFEALKATLMTDPELSAPHLPNLKIQPVAGRDLAQVIDHVIAANPNGALVEVAGPERRSLPEVVTLMMRRDGDMRHVVTDHAAEYLGTVFEPGDSALLPTLRLGQTSLLDWLAERSSPQLAASRQVD